MKTIWTITKLTSSAYVTYLGVRMIRGSKTNKDYVLSSMVLLVGGLSIMSILNEYNSKKMIITEVKS